MTNEGGGVAPDYRLVEPMPYVLRIGVTGHRALKDEAAVRAAIEKLVRRIDLTLRRSVEEPRSAASSKRDLIDWSDRCLLMLVKAFWWTMPVTPAHVPRDRQVPLQWRVVSPLAKGADQIVADVISKDTYGEIHVVLPFPASEYERDFESTEEKAAFRALLGQASKTDVALDVTDPSENERSTGYRLAGERVVEQSDIIIGVWDGDEARGEGGTAQIVGYAARNGVPVYWIDAETPDGEPTLISNRDDLTGEGCPLPETAKEILPHYHQLCAYYRTPAFRESEYGNIYAAEHTRLIENGQKLTSDRMREAIQRRLPDYAYADQLATRHQALLMRSARLVIGFAAAAVTVAAVHLLAFRELYWLILLEIALMLASAAVLRVSIRERWHEKWLNNRYLAERLRSLMFRDGLGQPPLEVNSIRELYPFYEGPAAWVDAVLKSVQRYVPASENRDDPVSTRKFLNTAWIGYQADWHNGNVDKKKKSHDRFHRTGYSLFALTLVCAVLHWFHVGGEHSVVHMRGLPETIEILAVVLPAWGGAVHAIAHLMDHARIAAQSQRMHRQLANLSEDLERSESIEAITAVAEKADKLMAVENSEWMMTLAYRKPELHV